MRKARIALVTTIIGAALGLQAAEAGKVRVSFDNDGDGNFVVQGFVETFDATGQTAAQVYKYNNPCIVSYSGVLFTPAQNKTTLAVVDTDDGRTLFVVHDISERGGSCPYPDLASGEGLGFSNNFYVLSFDGDGIMDCLVKDDGGSGGLNDLYFGCSTNTVEAQHGWGHPNTDGIVLGSLDGPWRLDMVYDKNSPAVNGSILNMPTSSSGITDVVVISSGEMDFSTQPPDTVRLDNVLEVAIDVKPGSDPNCFNINGHGVVPVAIFGSEDFDVSHINTTTLRFGGLVVRVRGKGDPQCSIKDVNGDPYPDMVCQFEDDAGAWDVGDATAELSSELNDTTPFYGEDAICIRPPE